MKSFRESEFFIQKLLNRKLEIKEQQGFASKSIIRVVNTGREFQENLNDGNSLRELDYWSFKKMKIDDGQFLKDHPLTIEPHVFEDSFLQYVNNRVLHLEDGCLSLEDYHKIVVNNLKTRVLQKKRIKEDAQKSRLDHTSLNKKVITAFLRQSFRNNAATDQGLTIEQLNSQAKALIDNFSSTKNKISPKSLNFSKVVNYFKRDTCLLSERIPRSERNQLTTNQCPSKSIQEILRKLPLRSTHTIMAELMEVLRSAKDEYFRVSKELGHLIAKHKLLKKEVALGRNQFVS